MLAKLFELRQDAPFKVNNFDLIRIFAATQVLILHAISRLSIDKSAFSEALALFPGVPIFFVISGFLVSASLQRSPTLTAYFSNRFRRIFPGLWVCLLVTVVVVTAFGFAILNPAGLAWLVAQAVGLIYTPAALNDFGMGSYNGSLWTIPVELQFYFILPIIFVVFGGRKLAGVALGFVVFAAFAVAAHHLLPGMGTLHERGIEKLVRYTFAPHVYLFFAGALLQMTGFWRSRIILGKGLYWLAAYVLAHLAFASIPLLSIPTTLLMAVAVISIAYTGNSHDILKGKDISYGVYIYHGLVLNVLVEMGLKGSPWLLLVVAGSAYVLGAVSWFFIEKPALKGKRQALVDVGATEAAGA